MKGFHIIDIMLVLAILGIITGLALPAYQDYAWLHDYSHPERLEKYNKLHNKKDNKNESAKDCRFQKRLLKEDCN